MLSIKDVPDAWAEVLRQRAARNHRSLQGELMALVEKAVIETGPVADATQASILRRGNKTVEEIAKEHRKRFPKPITDGLLAVDIVRADRDSR